jgi:hypothetical protein
MLLKKMAGKVENDMKCECECIIIFDIQFLLSDTGGFKIIKLKQCINFNIHKDSMMNMQLLVILPQIFS